jgi:5-methylcytosine-specific restriction endonuclease McrA
MTVTCVVCGSDTREELWDDEHGKLILVDGGARATTIWGRRVCDGCADHIANTWWHAISGAYLTWPNPPIEQPKVKKKIPPKLRKQVWERDAYRCRQCGTHVDLAVDHIHPESAGGETVLENLQTLCTPCNVKKGKRAA